MASGRFRTFVLVLSYCGLRFGEFRWAFDKAVTAVQASANARLAAGRR